MTDGRPASGATDHAPAATAGAAAWRLLPDWRGAGLPGDRRVTAGQVEPPFGVELLQALARAPGAEFVLQDDWLWPRRGDWMARLDEVVLAAAGPLQLAGLGLGAHLVAAWAAHSRHAARVTAAWLIDPADTAAADAPPHWASWRQAVRMRLPFPARVIVAALDPRDEIGAARQQASRRLASEWGAQWTVR